MTSEQFSPPPPPPREINWSVPKRDSNAAHICALILTTLQPIHVHYLLKPFHQGSLSYRKTRYFGFASSGVKITRLVVSLLNEKHKSSTLNEFVPVSPSYCTRNVDPNNYYTISLHKHDYFCQSYFPRTIDLWSNLPWNLNTASNTHQF